MPSRPLSVATGDAHVASREMIVKGARIACDVTHTRAARSATGTFTLTDAASRVSLTTRTCGVLQTMDRGRWATFTAVGRLRPGEPERAMLVIVDAGPGPSAAPTVIIDAGDYHVEGPAGSR
jgi:hypothetical protein